MWQGSRISTFSSSLPHGRVFSLCSVLRHLPPGPLSLLAFFARSRSLDVWSLFSLRRMNGFFHRRQHRKGERAVCPGIGSSRNKEEDGGRERDDGGPASRVLLLFLLLEGGVAPEA